MWAIKLRKEGGGWVWVESMYKDDGKSHPNGQPKTSPRKRDRSVYACADLKHVDFTGYNCIKLIRVKE